VLLRLLVVLTIVAGLFATVSVAGAYAWFARDLPEIPPFQSIRFNAVSQVRSLHGMLLAERFDKRRYLVPRERIPKILVDAFLASEDERFLEHGGMDLKGVVRAAWTNLRAGHIKEGASTITQQVARSLLLGREKSLARKVREAILARRIEDIYTKDQILTLYLNLIFLGQGAYGVQAASQVYYGKDLDELTLGESATLAALPQSPGKVNPVSDPVETRVRRDRVLRLMRETGRISREHEAAAVSELIRTAPFRDVLGDRAPFSAMDALEEVGALADSRAEGGMLTGRGGITAWTTIDLGQQRMAEEAANGAATALSRRQGFAGPVATLESAKWDEFRRMNHAWLKERGWEPIPVGKDVLALVVNATKTDASIEICGDISGRIPLDHMRWAVPYDEFPVVNAVTGERRERTRTSLDGRLDAVDKALSAGDVILVRRIGAKDAAESQVIASEYELSLFPRPQAALMAMEPRSGYVPALVGGTDFDISQVDRTRSLRQTGSNVKPIYYSKAYDLGIPPSAVLSGAPFREGNWTPETGKDAEDLTLWEALTRSENAISLRVFRTVIDRVGAAGLSEWAKRLGWTRPFMGYPAEALGAEATPTELLGAYATFAAHGIRPTAVRVALIRDGEGRILQDHRSARDPMVGLMDAVAREVADAASSSRRAMSEESAYLMASNLRSVAERGTGRATRALGRPVCGKTGTLPFDVWFTGWTSDVAAVSWVGQDHRERWLGRTKANGKVFGADTALPAWRDFVAATSARRPIVDSLALPPPGITMLTIDPLNGVPQESGGIVMPHIKGTEPPPGNLVPAADVDTSEF
jgi:penicillin-binding protein 1A